MVIIQNLTDIFYFLTLYLYDLSQHVWSSEWEQGKNKTDVLPGVLGGWNETLGFV